jgi:TetR/AcrR family transcriptional regulator, transcriptional repressor for nem operon
MPRQLDTRSRLLETASGLIWRRSYYGTSVDLICESCGIKKGSFYHHFDSKQALAEAALDQYREFFIAQFDQAFSASREPLERVRVYIDSLISFQQNLLGAEGVILGCPLYALGNEIGTQEPALCEKIDSCLSLSARYFASAIRDGIAQGVIAPCEPDTRAEEIVMLVGGALGLARIRNDIAPLTSLMSAVLRLLK